MEATVPQSAPAPVAPPQLPRARRWWIAPVVLLLIAAGFVYVYAVDPEHGPSIPCAFHEWTGYYCPGCGATRAAHALVHGHPLTAFGFNPLAAIVLPVVAVRYGIATFRLQLMPRPLPARWVYAIFFLIIAYWIARNIPAYPFTLLAPS